MNTLFGKVYRKSHSAVDLLHHASDANLPSQNATDTLNSALNKTLLRTIHLNDPERNRASKFESNSITTTKYTLFTFYPIFYFEQFSKYSNLFFLLIATIQVTLIVASTA
jgi:Phospholipid-translocating ATPase N-terminal